MQGGSGMGLNVLVSFNWEVALGDQTLSRQEFTAKLGELLQ